jgi:hypothetical protein
MANFNVIPFGLLGHEVSFRDLAFERNLSNLELPEDYPDDLKQSIVKGVVEYVDISFNTKMEMSCSIVVEDNLYCISEIDLLSVS